MTLRNKTLLIIGTTLIALLMLLYLLAQTILLSSFIELEEQDVHQNVERVRTALFNQFTTLDSITSDWALWDDTYIFMADQNEAYLESNITDETLINLNVNVMLFISTTPQIVYGKAVDLQAATTISIPLSLQEYIADRPAMLRLDTPEERITGIIPLPEAPLLFVAYPILTSDNEGPSHGALMIGRYLNTAEIKALGQATQLNVSLHRFGDSHLPADVQAAQTALSSGEGPIFVAPLSDKTTAGYTLLADIYNQPIFLLKIELPRQIYQQGQTTLVYLILAILVSGLIFGLVITLLLERGILSRLSQLNHSVTHIATHGDLTTRVSITGRDELLSLANAINSMLAALWQSQQELAVARDQALAASRLKTELMAKVSHELRTPLGVILGYAEMLQGEFYGPLVNDQQAPLNYIIDSSHYLTRHVNELLDQAKLEAGRLELYINTFVLADLVNQVHSQMEVLAQAKELTLTTQVAVEMPATLFGDPIRLQQILVNLVSNAIKFTKMGSIHISIYKPDQTHWAIQVSDTGPGIPIEAQSLIFEPFRQVDGSETREHGGTGLGLSIVKQLVTLMKGEITLDSQIRQGSTFTVLLPLEPIQEAVT